MRKSREEIKKDNNFSGNFNLRIPKDLHEALFYKALQEGVSMNMLVALILTQQLNKRICNDQES